MMQNKHGWAVEDVQFLSRSWLSQMIEVPAVEILADFEGVLW